MTPLLAVLGLILAAIMIAAGIAALLLADPEAAGQIMAGRRRRQPRQERLFQ